MYTELVVKHFQNSAPKVVRVPIPRCLQDKLAAILILHNPKYPRHFLNGWYFILQETTSDTDLLSQDQSLLDGPHQPLEMEELLLSLIRCPDTRWPGRKDWRNPLLSHCGAFSLSATFLGWPHAPRLTGARHPSLPNVPSLIMSLRPTYAQIISAALRCYLVQLRSDSYIVDGRAYFCSQFPAKRSLSEHENAFAWVCGRDAAPVGYIQYLSLENDEANSHFLISGLAVEGSHRRRGFARALIHAVLRDMSLGDEVWIAVQEDNQPALALYSKCGFVMRKRQWDSSIKVPLGRHSRT